MIVLALAIVCPLVAIGTSLVVVRARRSAGTTTTTRPLGESYVGCSILSTGVGSTKHRMRLKKHGDVPAVMQRAGILTAYRYGLSNTECIKSCVTVTNELANQWTHGLPLLWASWTAYLEVCKFVAGSLTEIELGVSMAYFLLVILCLGSSFVYHTFGCRSAEHCWDLCHVDHIGVVLGTLASYFPALYYGMRRALVLPSCLHAPWLLLCTYGVVYWGRQWSNVCPALALTRTGVPRFPHHALPTTPTLHDCSVWQGTHAIRNYN